MTQEHSICLQRETQEHWVRRCIPKALGPGVAARPNALQPHLMLLGLAATPHPRVLGLARWVWVRLQCHTLTATHNAFGFGSRTQEQYL
jgi:hypothetical protein